MPQFENSFWLLILLAVPAVGALITTALPVRAVRGWALGVSLVTLVVSIILGVQLVGADHHAVGWMGARIGAVNASFSLFVDPISIWLVLLTTFLMPLTLAFSMGSIRDRQREYYAWMLTLLVFMLGVFIARDLLLFYIFFEMTLVPMFFIIGIWGGRDRRYAASRYFLYTFFGGVFTLAAVIYLGVVAQSFDIPKVIEFAQMHMSETARLWVLLGLLVAFAVKTPLFPLHTLPPIAYTEAPAAGSALLAGVVLKSGTYGLLRLALPIGLIATGGATHYGQKVITIVGIVCVIGVIYAALVAWVQQDIKKLVVYSSISHIGFCVLGLFALNVIGMQGGVLYMVNHGLSIAALFLIIGMISDRFGTRDINQLTGLGGKMPILSFFLVFFTLASIGLPGLNGFVSEFLTILGAFTSDYLGIIFGVLAALGIVLGALYMLHMVAKIVFGPSDGEKDDIGCREIAILTPIALACLLLGVKPGLILDPMLAPVREMRQPLETQIVAAPAAAKTTEAQRREMLIKSLKARLARMRLDPSSVLVPGTPIAGAGSTGASAPGYDKSGYDKAGSSLVALQAARAAN